MQVQLTNAGAALLNANTGPISLTAFKIGSAFNYIPEPTDTDIHGTLLYTGVPSAPVAANANVVKYSGYLDYNQGPFAFGEVGLYTANGTLFALATSNELIYKIALAAQIGNSIRLDVYLSMVNQNYNMWLDLAESSNDFRMAVLGSVDQLPPPQEATPNAYIISGLTSQQSSFMAYTDRNGLWNFDAYEYANQAQATITASDFQSVTIALSDYVPGMSPGYFGAVILEFTTGALYGICRNIRTAVISGNTVTLGFANSLMVKPIVGDKFSVFGRQALSTTIPNLPIASHSQLGAVIVGDTLTVDNTGLLNIAPTAYPVLSVNGMTGDVLLTATNITGFAAVATSGKYSDLSGAPPIYTLPVATTTVLGGVKAPTTNNLTIAGDGTIDLDFIPVKTVNGASPDPSTGNVVVGIPIATTTQLGGVKASALVPVAADGTLGLALTVNGASITGTDIEIPIATSAKVGTVKSSSSITVAGDGTLGLGPNIVQQVNGISPTAGNVNIIGLVGPVQITNAANMNTYQTTGLFYILDADASSITNLPSNNGGILDIAPLSATATGSDVIQRYTTSSSFYFRRYTKTLNQWSTWVAVSTTASLPLATTSSAGIIQVGGGLNVTAGGILSAAIQSVNGHNGSGSPFIVLTAADVSAIPTSALATQGGVATLNQVGATVTPATDSYTYGRLPFYQNTLGTWWNAGTWNASTNVVTLTGQTDTITGQTLLAAGKQTIDISYDNLDPNSGTSPNLQTVSGEGMVYRVTTAGTTSLDGTAQWDVGDLVVAVQGVWTKITVNFNNMVFSAGTF